MENKSIRNKALLGIGIAFVLIVSSVFAYSVYTKQTTFHVGSPEPLSSTDGAVLVFPDVMAGETKSAEFHVTNTASVTEYLNVTTSSGLNPDGVDFKINSVGGQPASLGDTVTLSVPSNTVDYAVPVVASVSLGSSSSVSGFEINTDQVRTGL